MNKKDKYTALNQFFMNKEDPLVVLTFEEIENIIQFKLPQMAYNKAEEFFSNDKSHNQAAAWLDAGYETDCVTDTSEIELITFVRPCCVA